MKKTNILLLVGQCTFSLPVFSQGGVGVKNGMTAPDFTGKDQNGDPISLSQYKGKKVVLYFYPKDDTPGCTAEACSIRDNYDSLTKAGYTILGVSTDDERSHKDFKAKYHLHLLLLLIQTHLSRKCMAFGRKKKGMDRSIGARSERHLSLTKMGRS
jgi:peroxiredoxin Q/BCP